MLSSCLPEADGIVAAPKFDRQAGVQTFSLCLDLSDTPPPLPPTDTNHPEFQIRVLQAGELKDLEPFQALILQNHQVGHIGIEGYVTVVVKLGLACEVIEYFVQGENSSVLTTDENVIIHGYDDGQSNFLQLDKNIFCHTFTISYPSSTNPSRIFTTLSSNLQAAKITKINILSPRCWIPILHSNECCAGESRRARHDERFGDLKIDDFALKITFASDGSCYAVSSQDTSLDFYYVPTMSTFQVLPSGDSAINFLYRRGRQETIKSLMLVSDKHDDSFSNFSLDCPKQLTLNIEPWVLARLTHLISTITSWDRDPLPAPSTHQTLPNIPYGGRVPLLIRNCLPIDVYCQQVDSNDVCSVTAGQEVRLCWREDYALLSFALDCNAAWSSPIGCGKNIHLQGNSDGLDESDGRWEWRQIFASTRNAHGYDICLRVEPAPTNPNQYIVYLLPPIIFASRLPGPCEVEVSAEQQDGLCVCRNGWLRGLPDKLYVDGDLSSSAYDGSSPLVKQSSTLRPAFMESNFIALKPARERSQSPARKKKGNYEKSGNNQFFVREGELLGILSPIDQNITLKFRKPNQSWSKPYSSTASNPHLLTLPGASSWQACVAWMTLPNLLARKGRYPGHAPAPQGTKINHVNLNLPPSPGLLHLLPCLELINECPFHISLNLLGYKTVNLHAQERKSVIDDVEMSGVDGMSLFMLEDDHVMRHDESDEYDHNKFDQVVALMRKPGKDKTGLLSSPEASFKKLASSHAVSNQSWASGTPNRIGKFHRLRVVMSLADGDGPPPIAGITIDIDLCKSHGVPRALRLRPTWKVSNQTGKTIYLRGIHGDIVRISPSAYDHSTPILQVLQPDLRQPLRAFVAIIDHENEATTTFRWTDNTFNCLPGGPAQSIVAPSERESHVHWLQAVIEQPTSPGRPLTLIIRSCIFVRSHVEHEVRTRLGWSRDKTRPRSGSVGSELELPRMESTVYDENAIILPARKNQDATPITCVPKQVSQGLAGDCFFEFLGVNHCGVADWSRVVLQNRAQKASAGGASKPSELPSVLDETLSWRGPRGFSRDIVTQGETLADLPAITPSSTSGERTPPEESIPKPRNSDSSSSVTEDIQFHKRMVDISKQRQSRSLINVMYKTTPSGVLICELFKSDQPPIRITNATNQPLIIHYPIISSVWRLKQLQADENSSLSLKPPSLEPFAAIPPYCTASLPFAPLRTLEVFKTPDDAESGTIQKENTEARASNPIYACVLAVDEQSSTHPIPDSCLRPSPEIELAQSDLNPDLYRWGRWHVSVVSSSAICDVTIAPRGVLDSEKRTPKIGTDFTFSCNDLAVQIASNTSPIKKSENVAAFSTHIYNFKFGFQSETLPPLPTEDSEEGKSTFTISCSALQLFNLCKGNFKPPSGVLPCVISTPQLNVTFASLSNSNTWSKVNVEVRKEDGLGVVFFRVYDSLLPGALHLADEIGVEMGIEKAIPYGDAQAEEEAGVYVPEFSYLCVDEFTISGLPVVANAALSSPVFLSFTDLPMDVPALIIKNVTTTSYVFWQELAAHYSAFVLLNSPQLLASMDLLGNPTKVYRHLRTGVSEWMSSPLSQQGLLSLAKHVGSASLSGVSAFTDALRRNLPATKEAEDGYHVSGEGGVVQGAGMFLSGLKRGVKGVGSPRHQGISGAGRSVVGVLTEPVAGALDMVSTAARGYTTSCDLPLASGQHVLPGPEYFSRAVLRPRTWSSVVWASPWRLLCSNQVKDDNCIVFWNQNSDVVAAVAQSSQPSALALRLATACLALSPTCLYVLQEDLRIVALPLDTLRSVVASTETDDGKGTLVSIPTAEGHVWQLVLRSDKGRRGIAANEFVTKFWQLKRRLNRNHDCSRS